MSRTLVFIVLAAAAVAVIVALMRRRPESGLEHEMQSQYPGAGRNGSHQEPEYRGGEMLGQAGGSQHFPAQSGGY